MGLYRRRKSYTAPAVVMVTVTVEPDAGVDDTASGVFVHCWRWSSLSLLQSQGCDRAVQGRVGVCAGDQAGGGQTGRRWGHSRSRGGFKVSGVWGSCPRHACELWHHLFFHSFVVSGGSGARLCHAVSAATFTVRSRLRHPRSRQAHMGRMVIAGRMMDGMRSRSCEIDKLVCSDSCKIAREL